MYERREYGREIERERLKEKEGGEFAGEGNMK